MRNQSPKVRYINQYKTKTPELRYDGSESFDIWQKKAYDKLWEILGLDLIKKCDIDYLEEERNECDEYTQIRFSFQSEQGYYAPAVIRIPKNHEGELVPMICLQGHTTGMHISLGEVKYPIDSIVDDLDFAIHALKNGYCPIILEQRYMGECGGDNYGPGCSPSGLRKDFISVYPTLMLGRTAVGERVWDVSRLIDVLYEKFSFLALDKLICMGVSGGGTATFYSSCIDQRIKTSITSNAFCSYLNSIVEISHCPCNHIPSIARYFDMGDLAGLVAPRNLMIVSGDSDPIFPTKNAKEQFEIAKRLYDAAGVGDKIVQVIGDGGHRFFADRCYPVLANMLEKNK